MDPDKIPLCRYFFKGGECLKGDRCEYQHTRPGGSAVAGRSGGASDWGGDANPFHRNKSCPYYDRGFCNLGKVFANPCPFNHEQLTNICVNYMNGFCPLGPECK